MTTRITRTTRTITTTKVNTRNPRNPAKRSRYSAFPIVAVDLYVLQEALRYLEKLGKALDHKRMLRLVEVIDSRVERQII